ncbi:MAG TPA: hypothetical protein VMR52_04355 [Dehalococcoidia bacterium]|nr:hypothetical protein [Dehalococcoidia bacterium]
MFGILGLLFYARSAIGSPRIGDHNHAPYAFFVCGEKQPNFREYHTSTGIHTHGDGVIHLHPSNSTGEGAGAAVRRWVEAEGGKLSGSELRVPQYTATTYKTSDGCEGENAEIRVLRADSGIHPLGGAAPGQSFGEAIAKCDSLPWSAYENVGGRHIPQDGDCIRVVFGPPQSEPVVQTDRTILPEEEATRTVELGIDGSEVDTILFPARIDAYAAETIKVVVRNTSVALHGLRFAGMDGEYGTPDDYVTEPPTLEPGQEGTVIIRFDNGGEYEFRDELGDQATGTVTVSAGTAPLPSPTPAPEERFDADVSIEATEDSFAPAEVSADAGQALRITSPRAAASLTTFAWRVRTASIGPTMTSFRMTSYLVKPAS